MTYKRPEKIYWRPNEDDLILNHWGMGMERLREHIPNRTTSDILGRRIHLLKKKGIINKL